MRVKDKELKYGGGIVKIEAIIMTQFYGYKNIIFQSMHTHLCSIQN